MNANEAALAECGELDLVLRSRRVVTEHGERSLAVGVSGGVIVALEPFDARLSGRRERILDDDEVLLPGLVDSHVHVNDPGRTDWEGFWSATRAAAAGGVTTLIDMPLNSIPPTVTVDALRIKQQTAAPQVFIDVGFWGGAVPDNLADLRGLYQAGAFGFKAFLLHSGVDEFPALDAGQLEAAMREIASFDGLIIVHAEDAGRIDHAPHPQGRSYQRFLASRPPDAEQAAVAQVIELVRRTGCRAHILHVSSDSVLPLLMAAQAGGLPVSAETCPHYLSFAAEEIPDGATEFKCCPPIRDARNRDGLWEGLRDGVLSMIVSDHSPSTVDLKAMDSGDFATAWGGVSSLQLGLSAVWTQARLRGFTMADVVGWMCTGPARLVGLERKARIAVGCDADFAVFAPDRSFVVDVNSLYHKNPVTPYAGRTLSGVVTGSWLRGQHIDIHTDPDGALLVRPPASASSDLKSSAAD